MPHTSRHLATFAFSFALLGLTPAAAIAQVPDGTAIVGTAVGPASAGTCGLFLVPLAGGAVTPVTGLPPELALASGGGFVQGVGSVALRSPDGAIVVGSQGDALGPHGGRIDLFVLHLSGSTVIPAQTQQVLLGYTASRSSALAVPLPDGRILVWAGQGVGGLASGPMAGYTFAIVDSSLSLTPLPGPNIAGLRLGGLAVDPTGQYAYLASNSNGDLYRWDFTANVICTIASWPGQLATGLTCDDDGKVYVATADFVNTRHSVHVVDPSGCAPAAVVSALSPPTTPQFPPVGVALDRATGHLIVPSGAFGPGFPSANLNSLWSIDPATGAAALSAAPLPGGWGAMGKASVAVNNAIESYGAPSDGQNHYWFENFPNPGGQPTIGNATFSLTIRSAPTAPAATLLALSFGRGSTTVAGMEILVDLGAAVSVFLPAGISVFAMPLPANPAFTGVEFNAQSLHADAAGFAASAGLTFTIQ